MDQKAKYTCDECKKDYTHQRSLKRHLKQMHLHSSANKLSSANPTAAVKDEEETSNIPEPAVMSVLTPSDKSHRASDPANNYSMDVMIQNMRMACDILYYVWTDELPDFLPPVTVTIIKEIR